MLALTLGMISGDIFVAPNGSDSAPGTAQQPVATLAKAVDQARIVHAKRIIVRTGAYYLNSSIELDSRDNGLTIEAAPNSHPWIIGGKLIPENAIQSCHDATILNRIIDKDARQSVREIDLRQIGIQGLDPVHPRGFPHAPDAAPEELFFGSQAGILARWPNTGFAKIQSVIEPGNGENDQDKPKRKPVFNPGERSKLWANAADVWMYGYWNFDWADESIAVDKIDPETGAITLSKPHVYGVVKGAHFFAENLIEELDQPMEYAFDRKALKLYFIPNQNVGRPVNLYLSTLKAPIIDIKNATKIRVQGLEFGMSRGDGVHIQNCSETTLTGCNFFSLGARAAVIDGGHDSGLQSCNIAHSGEGGVSLSGGDRNTLTPARNFVRNCDIGDYQRRSQTYRPAVSIAGVGNEVVHCAMHDAPHSAIIYGGNNHLIQFNEFYRTVALTGDGGVVYTGRNWTARGTRIVNNYFHDNMGEKKWEPAIYVDDLGSGIIMSGNLIERCHWGFLIGGGRDNIMDHNVLIDCHLGFDCDARGLGWAARSRPTMMEGLNAVPYQSPIWRTSYPGLPNILQEDPMAPAGNIMRKNLLVRTGTITQRMEAAYKKTVQLADNLEVEQADSALIRQFLPIGKEHMGLLKDKIRIKLRPVF